MSAETRAARSKVAGLTARRADQERIEAARAELKALRIREEVAGWPPLTDAQKIELARLLLDGEAS